MSNPSMISHSPEDDDRFPGSRRPTIAAWAQEKIQGNSAGPIFQLVGFGHETNGSQPMKALAERTKSAAAYHSIISPPRDKISEKRSWELMERFSLSSNQPLSQSCKILHPLATCAER